MMKRKTLYALLVTVLACTFGVAAQAQTARPDFESLAKKLAKSDKKIADAKKGADVGTWLDRGELLEEIAGAHSLFIQPGWDVATVMLVMGKPQGVEQVSLKDKNYNVLHYGEVDVYASENKQIAFSRVVRPVVTDPLRLAYDAYEKAASLDVKKKKTKKIADGLNRVRSMLFNEGASYYSQGEYGKAGDALELSVEVGQDALVHANDTVAMYYAGLARYYEGQKEEALEYLKKALDNGYKSNGEAICSYYEVAKEVGKIEEAKAVLESNISKFPAQKCLMLSMVDYYISQGKDPREALPYLERAIENDPTNAQLLFVKGIVLQKMGDEDGALQAFTKSNEIQPDFVDPIYNVAVMYYNDGVEAQRKAIEDGKKYDEYMEQANVLFKKSLSYAEKAMEIQAGHEGTVDILRSLYFKYRQEPGMQAKLDALTAKYPAAK